MKLNIDENMTKVSVFFNRTIKRKFHKYLYLIYFFLKKILTLDLYKYTNGINYIFFVNFHMDIRVKCLLVINLKYIYKQNE